MPAPQYFFGELIYFEALVRFLFSHLATWLFFMVLLINFVRTSIADGSNNEKQKASDAFLLSLVMFFSYASAIPIDYLYRLTEAKSAYYPKTFYLVLDVLTIVFLFYFIKVRTVVGNICKSYLLIALSSNSYLFLLAKIDLLLMYEGYKELKSWWFWTLFTFAINTFDLIMVLVLVIQKDFLGWYKLAEKIKGAQSRP
jgi:hypothetical protein